MKMEYIYLTCNEEVGWKREKRVNTPNYLDIFSFVFLVNIG